MSSENIDKKISFSLQIGLVRESVTIESCEPSLGNLKEIACAFVDRKFPEHGFFGLINRILLFKHDIKNDNVLKLLSSSDEISDGALVEIVLSEQTTSEELLIQPHYLCIHSYKSPHFCNFCGEMLWGIVRQGLKCKGCGLDFHKRCTYKIPNNCSRKLRKSEHSRKFPLHAGSVTDTQSLIDEIPKHYENEPMRNSSWAGRPAIYAENDPGSRIKVPHTFAFHNYKKLTKCQFCKKMLKGLFRQGLQCKDCLFDCHKKCSPHVARDCKGEIKSISGVVYLESVQNSENDEFIENESNSNLLFDEDDDDDDNESKIPPLNHNASQNIPLMRVVQSIKHTKKPGSQILREGWMVHFTDKNLLRKRHFWKLDTNSITLYKNETTVNYFKDIKLDSILHVKGVENLPRNSESNPHVFEIITANYVYMVGEDPTFGGSEIAIVNSAESGIGLEQAISWKNAINAALMPHVKNDVKPNESESKSDHHSPAVKNQDISTLYQIFPDDILGSGQFGTVYGGRHKKNTREVAIKVIDKLRFPTKQEEQLKSEVSILQMLHHPGVVNLDNMFETPEKIYVVMEKLQGDMLEMILSSSLGRLSQRTTKFLIYQILIALKYLHSNSVVHCDLKPENVLLSTQCIFPQVKLCDFGFSRIIGEKSFRRSVVGTPAYLAPEVLKNKGYNRSLDMWSVGVILYVSLSGTFPFNEDEEIADQIQNAAFMYPPTPWKDVSIDAVDLINSLLQLKIRKRFTVDKTLSHIWLQDYQLWSDLRKLEESVGPRYLTHESDDDRWNVFSTDRNLPSWKTMGFANDSSNEIANFVKSKNEK